MIQLQNIVSRCAATDSNNRGGVFRIQITDFQNWTENGGIEEGATIYEISFKEFSGDLQVKSATSRAGDYLNISCTFTVPRQRYAANLFRDQLRDRRVLAIITDYNNDIYYLAGCKLISEFGTGKSVSDLNGYTFNLSGISTMRPYNLTTSFQSLTGDEGIVEGGDFGGEIVAVPTPAPPAEDCCVVVLQTVVNYTPEPTGNLANRNRFIITNLGEKYYIDKYGTSFKISASLAMEKVNGTGASIYTLTTITDATNTIVNRTQNVLSLAETPSDIHEYNIDSGELILPDDWPLGSDEYIEIYKIA